MDVFLQTVGGSFLLQVTAVTVCLNAELLHRSLVVKWDVKSFPGQCRSGMCTAGLLWDGELCTAWCLESKSAELGSFSPISMYQFEKLR